MPIVRLHGPGPEPDNEVFVSLEHTPVVMADIRAGLPQLKQALSDRWPIERVEIENRLPRMRNPIDASQLGRLPEIMADAGVGIAILFFAEAARAAGKKLGDTAGKEIGEYVRGWIKNVTHAQPVESQIPITSGSRRACECGCGEHPKNPKSRFLPGHDLKKAYNESGSASRRGKRISRKT